MLLQAPEHSEITDPELRTYDAIVSAQTVRNRVLEQGQFQRRSLRVPRLLPGNRVVRLAWPQEHLN